MGYEGSLPLLLNFELLALPVPPTHRGHVGESGATPDCAPEGRIGHPRARDDQIRIGAARLDRIGLRHQEGSLEAISFQFLYIKVASTQRQTVVLE